MSHATGNSLNEAWRSDGSSNMTPLHIIELPPCTCLLKMLDLSSIATQQLVGVISAGVVYKTMSGLGIGLGSYR